jgi:hypothetical protein
MEAQEKFSSRDYLILKMEAIILDSTGNYLPFDMA